MWTPRFVWANAVKVEDINIASPLLLDRSTGRVKLTIKKSGVVENPMRLKAFPFDIDDIEIKLETGVCYRSADGSRVAAVIAGRQFIVRKIQEEGEGRWIGAHFHGTISEWRIHGVSTRILHKPPNSTGTTWSNVFISVHLSRSPSYYFW
jgi:hypothetical protein